MMPRTSLFRIVVAVCGFVAALIAPPWVAMLAVVILALRYAAWEALFIGLLIDLAWLPAISFQHLPLYTLFAIAIVWGLEPLRSRFL